MKRMSKSNFPPTGQYQLRVQAAGDQAGPEPAKMAIRIDGRDVRVHEVRGDSRSPPEIYTTRINVQAGKRKVGVAFINDLLRAAERAIEPGEDRNLFVGDLEVRGPLGMDPRTTVRHRIARSSSRSRTSRPVKRKRLARFSLDWRPPRFAARCSRRKSTGCCKLVELADQQGDSFETGIQLALQAILVSPHFLFRVEMDPAEEEAYRRSERLRTGHADVVFPVEQHAGRGAVRAGSPGQLATRTTIWSSRCGACCSDPKSAALIENFAGQWLQLRSLEDMAFDTQRFPGCDRELLAAMRTETLRFFEEIVRSDLSILTVLDADFTFVNEALARHYGIEGVSRDELSAGLLEGHSARRRDDSGQHPGSDLQSDAHLTSQTRQVRAGEPAGYASATAAGQRTPCWKRRDAS